MIAGGRRTAQSGISEVTSLTKLGREFARRRAACQRAWRRYQASDETIDPVAASQAHRRWSGAIEDALAAIERISGERPSDFHGLLLQYEAIWWWISEDDSVLDRSTRRWLMRFRRSLRRLAT